MDGWKNILPVLQFEDSVVQEDPTARLAFEAVLGPCSSKTDELESYVRRRYWYFIRTGRDSKVCPAHQRVVTKLYFNLVNSPLLNAHAMTWQDTNLIGTNVGAAVNIFAFFHMILSHPKVLPQYGFVTKEVPWLVSLSGCDWRAPLGVILAGMTVDESAGDGSKTPTNWIRQSIADTLATMALDFVFFHELTHLRRGHLHFLHVETGALQIDESRTEAEASIKRAKQAFELDADGGAMEITLGPWLAGAHVKGFQADEATPEEAIELWTIAVAFLFVLFDPFPSPIPSYRTEEHPHPMVRLSHIYLQASHIAEQSSIEARRRFQEAWWRALGYVGEVSAILGLPSSVGYSLLTEKAEVYIAEQQQVVTHLMELVGQHESLQI